jgi:carbon monoxide dehydrogenase subunit G
MNVGDIAVVAHRVPGRLRLRLRGHVHRGALLKVEQVLLAAEGVLHVRLNESAASIVVDYDPAQQREETLLGLPVGEAQPMDLLETRVDENLLIHAAPAAVWAVLDRSDGAVAHFPSVLHVANDGPDAWLVTVDLLGRSLHGRVQVTESIPGERLALELHGSVAARYMLTLSPELGGTRVRERVWYDLRGTLLDLVVGSLAEPALHRMVREHLATLQRLSTAAAAGQQAG